MSVSNKPEFASTYGCLDTDALADGQAAHSHALRELSRSVNRLLQIREPVLNVVFDASTDQAELTNGSNYGHANAVEFAPLIFGGALVQKKANHQYIDVRIIANFGANLPVTLHVRTTQTDLTRQPTPQNPGVLNVIGSGNYQVYELKNIPASRNEVEHVEFFVKGSDSGVLGDTATYGTPNTGSGDFSFNLQSGVLDVRGASWNTQNTGAASWADTGEHYVIIRDYETDTIIMEPRKIIQVYRMAHSHTEILHFEPIYSYGPQAFVNYGTAPKYKWEITKIIPYRVASITAYSKLEATG